jgi:hypothetical protein
MSEFVLKNNQSYEEYKKYISNSYKMLSKTKLESHNISFYVWLT